jgi:predicted permease
MVASLILIKKIAQLFLIMIMGFTIVRTKLLKSEDSRILSVLLVYLITPCVIINSFQIDCNQEILNKLVFSFVLAIIVHAILIFFTFLLNKVKKLDVVEKTNIIYTNAGVLVIPLVAVLLGEEYVVYSCAFIIVQLILLWTHCKILLCPSQAIDWKKFIYDINIISILIGEHYLFFT